MQGKKILAAVTGLAVFTLSTPALAIMSAPSGWYLEGNAGSTHISNVSYPGSTSSSGLGGNASAGYKFMPYFAAEIGYTQYAGTSIKAPDGTKAGTVKNYSYDLAARGILPISESGLELFGKLGIEQVRANVSLNNNTAANLIGLQSEQHSCVGAYVGGGGQYYFTPEFAAVIQWEEAIGNNKTGNMALFSGGLSFIFD